MWAKDLLTALILLLVAGGYYAGSRGINQSALADEVGAAGLPIAYASALAALALALIVKTFVTWRFVGLTGVRAGSRAGVRYEGRAEVRAEGRSGAGVGNEFRGEGARLLRAAGMLANSPHSRVSQAGHLAGRCNPAGVEREGRSGRRTGTATATSLPRRCHSGPL